MTDEQIYISPVRGATALDNEAYEKAYEVRRQAAAKAVRDGMTPAYAAKKFRVPVAFCRYVARGGEA